METLIQKESNINPTIKVIVRPERVQNINNPHKAVYKSGYFAMTQNGYRIDGEAAIPSSENKLIIRHYSNGDLQYYNNIKVKRYIEQGWPFFDEGRKNIGNEVIEDSDMRWFLPALRQRMFSNQY